MVLRIVAVLTCLGVIPADQQHRTPPKLMPLDVNGRITYFIAEGIKRSGYKPGDTELATWALNEWARGSGGVLQFEPSTDEGRSLIRIYWLPPAIDDIGEMQPSYANRRPTALVFIRPDTESMSEGIARRTRQDPLVRDTIVFILCLHELGHALGLGDSSNDADIMWGGGRGDLGVYERYRKRLRRRDSIAQVSWLSKDDLTQLTALYHR